MQMRIRSNWSAASNAQIVPTRSALKDRPCDVALLPNGRLVVMVELAPETPSECTQEGKIFGKIY